MALFTNFKLGFKTYGEAHRFIKKNKLWWYVFLPGIINLVLLVLLFVFGIYYAGLFTEWFFGVTGLSNQPEGFLKYLVVALKWVLKILLYIVLFFLYASVYRYIVLIILSPALALLSEKTDKIITSNEYPFSFSVFIKDVLRGILIVVRNTFIETGFIIGVFLISFIPVIRYFGPVFLFFLACYYYGFSMIDYSNERNRMSVRESVRFVRRNRGLAIANGMVFYFVFFFIPLIGFLIAPAYAVVAATIAVHKINTEPSKNKPLRLKK
jgi:CysZ protein